MAKKSVSNITEQSKGLMAIFFGLILLFTVITFFRPVVGLSGLGVVAIIVASIIELNRNRIWEAYRKDYKKSKGIRGWWSEPNRLYFNLNTYFLWPLVGILGVACLWAAYMYEA
jgi:hypothetical protein